MTDDVSVSIWQCSQSATMQVLGVFDGLCYSSSRDEKADWQRAQRKCLDRGATLPMKITEIARRGVRSALATASLHSDYYWIGASSSLTNWRWADGSVVDEDEADWSTTAILPSNHAEAIVLARVVDWRWIPSVQKVWNSFLCQSSQFKSKRGKVEPKSCTFPGVDAAGRVSFTSQNLLIGTYAIYSCENGYELDGLAERRCEGSALWSGTIPKCRKRKCGHVEEWNSGGKIHLVNGSTEFDSEIEYVCPNGWKLIGVERRRCQEDGSWSGSAPFCKVVDCGAPPTISNGRVFTLMTTFGSQANYSCLDGYRLIGHDIVTCGAKGIWEPAIPVCYGKFLGYKINL
uniref:Sushi, von Willebrand factor type A, EGF and pentraxin domain-containing protein 1 n=1 Tax=Angiostrongylus cantonensis TaxID=6313 RepID=A0A158P8J7_ANGCA